MNIFSFIISLLLIMLLVLLIITNVVIVPQAHEYIIEFLGKYEKTWGAGLHIKIPLLERVACKVSLKEQVLDFEPQHVITKDNVGISVDSVVFCKVFNSKDYTYGVESPIIAIETLCATTLRNIIGELELDNTLTSRDNINSRIREILDDATDPWGIKVKRVELKNILPPREIQAAMEKQMKAERERRARILDAEGEKTSQILVAEGHKEAAILRADAIRETKIREAQGEAEAILAVQKAYADSLRMLNEASPSDRVIALKSLETFAKVADGRATKIIIPSEIQSMASLAASLKEIAVDGELDTGAVAPKVQKKTVDIPDITQAVDAQAAARERAKAALQQADRQHHERGQGKGNRALRHSAVPHVHKRNP